MDEIPYFCCVAAGSAKTNASCCLTKCSWSCSSELVLQWLVSYLILSFSNSSRQIFWIHRFENDIFQTSAPCCGKSSILSLGRSKQWLLKKARKGWNLHSDGFECRSCSSSVVQGFPTREQKRTTGGRCLHRAESSWELMPGAAEEWIAAWFWLWIDSITVSVSAVWTSSCSHKPTSFSWFCAAHTWFLNCQK